MKLILKYILWFLSLLILIFSYLFFTEWGEKSLKFLLGSYLSNESNNHIVVNRLNLNKYPKIMIDMNINKGSHLFLNGKLSWNSMDMNYTLEGESLYWNQMNLEDNVSVQGDIKGEFSALKIQGFGKIFEGKTRYHFTKKGQRFANVKIVFKQINSQKLLNYLEKKAWIHGKADIDVSFKYFTTYIKKGAIVVKMVDATMPDVSGNVPFNLNMDIAVKDLEYKYTGKIDSAIGTLVLGEGSMYHVTKKEAKSNYDLNIYELAYFENFLKHSYRGTLKTKGTILYKNKKFTVSGKTEESIDKMRYFYKDDNLLLDLEGTSLLKLLQKFSYPMLLDAKIYGTVEYNIKDSIVLINTQLRETHFRRTKLTDTIFSTTGIDMHRGVYNKSSFVGGYQNSKLTSILKIANTKDHIYLNNLTLSSKTNALSAKFDIAMRGEKLYGEIYGTLQDPKVSFDVNKVLRYQIDKRIEGLFGQKKKDKSIKSEFNELKKDVSNRIEEIDVEEIKSKTKSFFKNLL